MVLALVLAVSWGGWRLSDLGKRRQDRFVLRWTAAVSALLVLATALFPELLPVLHLWLVGVAAAALMLWVVGVGPVRLKPAGSRRQRQLLLESLAVLLLAWMFFHFF
ncbi:MAG: hypothetical protein JJU06_03040 [Ectothiorhodospiraceae bacterium]|nr:hypothetical protein [Ectothiorhodospiraceae bacterium]MCH8504671.1 hypothetical protein [Ectothiorhodospiraceae bacterium]